MNKSDIDILSITILNIQLPSNISWVVEGIVGLVGNALLFLVIAKTKNLKSNFYLCLMNIAIADSIFCFFLTYAGSQRLILTAKNLPATVSPIDCIPLFLPLATAKVVSPAQAVTIALDRFLCVAFPARYRHFEVKYLQLINLLMWAVPIVVMSYAGTFLNPASLIPLCTTGGAWLPVMNDISSFAGITLDLMTILLYGALALLLLFRIHVGRKNGEKQTERKMCFNWF